MSEKNNNIALSQEPTLEDTQIRNRESERLIDKYLNKRHYRVKRLNIRGSKIRL